MKTKIAAFIQSLMVYDYILFGVVLALFVLLLILAVILHKKTLLSVILIIISFGILLLGPTLGYIALHNYLFKSSYKIHEVKSLEFSQALVVKGEIHNASNRDFQRCKITANVYKVANNMILDLLYPLNPFKKTSILSEEVLEKSATRDFKIIVEPFTYTKDYNVSLGVNCQ